MPKKGANISLSSYDNIFSTEESRADQAAEKVQEIPLSELHPFKNHPFKVLDDESMERTVESIRRYGVMVPAIARPSPEGHKGGWRTWRSRPAVCVAQGTQQRNRLCSLVHSRAAPSGSEGLGNRHDIFRKAQYPLLCQSLRVPYRGVL